MRYNVGGRYTYNVLYVLDMLIQKPCFDLLGIGFVNTGGKSGEDVVVLSYSILNRPEMFGEVAKAAVRRSSPKNKESDFFTVSNSDILENPNGIDLYIFIDESPGHLGTCYVVETKALGAYVAENKTAKPYTAVPKEYVRSHLWLGDMSIAPAKSGDIGILYI